MANKELVPLADNVIVRPIEAETTTASGIVIPDTASKEKPRKGEVLAVGPGRLSDSGKREPVGVKKGDVVIFREYAPTEIKIDGKELYVLGADSLLAIEK
ncbi:MAG: co-chaperone GroES [Candidatus Gracilibacteria bacterium]|nr:co-chaperone GroES [Candidatus Gracilibacteria bacterium]